MDNVIDARGLSCPQPVLLAQRAMKASPSGLAITVDNYAARENLTRLATARGYALDISEANGEFTLTFKKE